MFVLRPNAHLFDNMLVIWPNARLFDTKFDSSALRIAACRGAHHCAAKMLLLGDIFVFDSILALDNMSVDGFPSKDSMHIH